MGFPKGLLPCSGKTWITRLLRDCRAAMPGKITVVLGYGWRDYIKVVPGLKRISVVNRAPWRGQFSSLKTGVRAALKKKACGAFVLPVDMPCPSKKTWQKLLGTALRMAHKPGWHHDFAVMPQYRGRGGHPVLLSGGLLKTISRTSTASRAARLDLLLSSCGNSKKIECRDPLILWNFNRPEDFTALCKTLKQS
ncbi:MAG: hypothetical protein A2583_03150 [Bdellovibrionales bacterium RIFOXYD1_FULL_53_11]|nr:MAG: hypothetical protein A2583_03150 [Bdellovibrionales bacterium RIFOXYD1_FULL_53_11]